MGLPSRRWLERVQGFESATKREKGYAQMHEVGGAEY